MAEDELGGSTGRLPRTLVEFFETMGADAWFYDLGRRVRRLENEEFRSFEETRSPYPLPLRRHAAVGIAFSPDAAADDPYLWFLRLPLDEQGRLLQAARDYVLRRLYEAFGRGLLAAAGSESAAPRRVMEDNPFSFRPDDTRLAVFRAKCARRAGAGPSGYYEPARAYYGGGADPAAWRSLGIQGVAELAVRLGEDSDRAVTDAIGTLPPEPFVALCTCLEHVRIPAALARSVRGRTERALATGEGAHVVAAGVRGLARSRDSKVRAAAVDTVLAAAVGEDIEVLASMAGRAWEVLDEPGRRSRFVERLAISTAGQSGFDAIASDLLFMPGLRGPVLETLRDPARSPQVRARLDAMLAARRARPDA